MKAIVNEELCIGCGMCESICPEVFQMNDDGIATVIAEVTDDVADSANEAKEACPTEAIEIA